MSKRQLQSHLDGGRVKVGDSVSLYSRALGDGESASAAAQRHVDDVAPQARQAMCMDSTPPHDEKLGRREESTQGTAAYLPAVTESA